VRLPLGTPCSGPARESDLVLKKRVCLKGKAMPSRRRILTTTSALLLVAVLAGPSAADLLTGRVVGVTDGDTLTVLRPTADGPRESKVRLEGIDAPEPGQDYGTLAKQRLSDLAYGKTVRVEVKGIDDFGRLVARVKVGELDISEELVRSGLAWHYKRYSAEHALDGLEREARAAKRGLWTVATPQAPWEYRQARQAGVSPHLLESPVAPRPPPAISGGAYHGNRSSKIFHRPGCQHYHCKNCMATFATREAAIAAGYRPGGCCRP